MNKPKKEGKYLNIFMDKEVYEELEKFCNDTGISKTGATERALKSWLKAQSKQSNDKEN